jgi:hypothetical protein
VVRPNAVEVAGLSPSKSRPTLSEVRDFADALISSAGAVVDHLDDLASALSGVVPDAPEKEKQQPPPAGIVDATFRRLLTLDALIGRMSRTASHIRNAIA